MRHLLVYLMMVALPAALMLADVQGAMLLPYGSNVTVNGGALSKSGSIFAGDKIQTGADSAATITMEGSNVFLPSGARVELGSNLLNVVCGGASISTTRGLGVQAGSVMVSPASDKATKFEVMQNDKWLQVVAREGKIFVRNGNESKPLSLAPGNSFTLKSASTCAQRPAAEPNVEELGNGAVLGISIGAAAGGTVLALCGTVFCRTSTERPALSPAVP